MRGVRKTNSKKLKILQQLLDRFGSILPQIYRLIGFNAVLADSSGEKWAQDIGVGIFLEIIRKVIKVSSFALMADAFFSCCNPCPVIAHGAIDGS